MARTSKRTVGDKHKTTQADVPPVAPASSLGEVHAMLANERTLQTWVHTAILLQAAGFALTQFGNSALRGPVGVLLVIFGGACAAIGYQRYQQTDRSIRGSALPEANRGPFLQAAGLVVLAVLMGGLQIAGVW